MNRYPAVLALLIPLTAQADVYDLYDGSTGVSCPTYNLDARIPWVRPGGDWVDADGVMHGDKPLVKFRTSTDGVGPKDIVLPAGIDASHLFVRKLAGYGWARVHSREASPGFQPLLIDSAGNQYTAFADAALPWSAGKCSSGYATGTATTWDPNRAIVAFKVPAGNYTLRLNLAQAGGGGAEWGVFTMRVPRPPESDPSEPGISVNYPNDEGIEKDPSVLYFEGFDADRDNWWVRTKGEFVKDWPSEWKVWGGVFHNSWTNAYWSDDAVKGTSLGSGYSADRITGAGFPTLNLKRTELYEVDEGFIRYYIKFSNFKNALVCDGGKFPGMGSDASVCGHAGAPSDGYCGWSARLGYAVTCDHNNPLWPRTLLGVYVYHALQAEMGERLYGNWWAANQSANVGFLEEDKWHCIEQHVKVNTPGVQDGVIEVWVDGKLGFRKTDMMLRRALDINHPEYDVPGNLGIQYIPWGHALFHGGKNPMGVETKIWADQIVSGTKRIGCMVPVSDPQPVEICGDGLDNDGDGAIDEGCAPPPAEVCGDGIDNDLDGAVDEDCTPPKTDLELALEALAKARADLEIANLQIATLEGALSLKGEQLTQAQIDLGIAQVHRDRAIADLAIAEGRLIAAQATIEKVREAVR